MISEAKECFLSGTAAGATAITNLSYQGKRIDFNNGKVGEVTAEIRDTLKGIQYGARPDTKGWLVHVQ